MIGSENIQDYLVEPNRNAWQWFTNDKSNYFTIKCSQPEIVTEVFVAAHPEGRDRGGLVVWVVLKSGVEMYFSDGYNEWLE